MNKSIKIIISILAIILISGAVFWSVKNRKQQKTEPTQNISQQNQGDGQDNQKQEDEIESIRDLIDGEYQFGNIDTSKWQTYRNEEMGFEVKIPRNWYVSHGYGDNEICFREKGKDYKSEGLNGLCGISIHFVKDVAFGKNNFSDVFKTKYQGQKLMATQIDGVDAIVDEGYGVETNFFKNNNFWTISFILGDNIYPEVAKTYPGVLKTFKFLK